MNTEQRQIQALYVTWQHQATKEYIPIGRLVGGLSPDLPEYEFCYLQGVNKAIGLGFPPLLSFPDVNRVYRSDDLFPLFQNRLMPTNRAEYRDFVSNLAMDPNHADPMTIMIRSGGGRITDSLEMFEVPKPSEEGNPYRARFLAHEIRYLHPTSMPRILDLRPDDRLLVMYDCQNPADSGALALRTEDRVVVGYMPRYLLGDAFRLLNACAVVECFVAQVNKPPAPLQQRLLCRLEGCWPPGFQPFASDVYKPISSGATNLSA